MAKAYFDSSVLLAVLLGEPKAAQAAALWQEHTDRVSSILMEAECFVNLRRYAHLLGKKIPAGWLDTATSVLTENMEGLSVQKVDSDIMEIIRREARLSDCRTLDAIHLATALFYKERADGDFFLVSFDEKMRRTATKLHLTVLPASL